jgi:site-specific DNA-cytosine methylase
LGEWYASHTKFLTGFLRVSYWFKLNKVDKHPNRLDHFQPRAGLAKFETLREGDVSKKSYKRLHRHRYSPTAAYGNNEVHIHPTEASRISVAEALAIQSLPSEFCLPPKMTLTNKFKTIGNGVPFLAAQGLAKTILRFLEEHTREADSRKPGQSSGQTTLVKVVRIHQRPLWDEGAGRQRRIA